MATNTKECGSCAMFWAMSRGLKGGATKTLRHGYCLHTTIFAKNKVGDKVYPPRAKVMILPNAMHRVTLVRDDDVKPTCEAYSAKGK